MNVTGVEWRDLDSHDDQLLRGRKPRHARLPVADGEEEDSVEIHGEVVEEVADGLDLVEELPEPQTPDD